MISFNFMGKASKVYKFFRSLQKLSSKLMKASKERSGTISNAWHFVANDFEQEAEIHKTIASAILDEIAKPLKVSNIKIVDICEIKTIIIKSILLSKYFSQVMTKIVRCFENKIKINRKLLSY